MTSNPPAARRALVIDVETTGLDPARHACIELGAVLLDEELETVWEFSSLICPEPGAEVCAEALGVSGITLAEALAAEPAAAVVRRFEDLVAQETAPLVLAGWNVWFDVSFLKVLYQQAGLSWRFGHRFLDVQSIVSFFFDFREAPQARTVEKYLSEVQSHRATADARQTAKLLRLMNTWKAAPQIAAAASKSR